MATQVRALPDGGWIVVDDTETFVRALPDGGWLVQEGIATGITGPLIGGSHLLTNGVLITGRLIL